MQPVETDEAHWKATTNSTGGQDENRKIYICLADATCFTFAQNLWILCRSQLLPSQSPAYSIKRRNVLRNFGPCDKHPVKSNSCLKRLQISRRCCTKSNRYRIVQRMRMAHRGRTSVSQVWTGISHAPRQSCTNCIRCSKITLLEQIVAELIEASGDGYTVGEKRTLCAKS